MSRGLPLLYLNINGGGIMAENNSVCSICGKEYYACLSCHDSIKTNPWKVFTDTSEHYKVFQVVRGYNTGVYTKDEAKIKFKSINLEDLESYRPHVKEIIKNILNEEVVVDTNVVEAEIVMEEKPVAKMTSSRKKNYKAETE
jgi:uncharacterized CHY-type Zn-finger protein